MKSLQTSLSCAAGLFALALFLGGCNIKWEVVQDPYINYHRIGQRVQIQLNQINNDVQGGSLRPPMAQVLSENDDTIRQLAWHYQGGQSVDLTPRQTAYLDSLLNDNALAINDAIARRDQWSQAFAGGWDFSYVTYSDRLLYIACLHYQLDRQQAAIDDALQSGLVTPAQAQDLKTRIQVIRNSETGCYSLNSRLDLTLNQIQRLRQMASDNDRFIRFRTHLQQGRWKGDEYGGWTGQKKQYTDNPWLQNTAPAGDPNQGQTNHSRYWDGRPLKRQASASTSQPAAPVPTVTPIPYHRVVSVPTATPIPMVSASTIVPTPRPTHIHAAAPTAASQPVVQAPTSTAVPAVSAPTHVQAAVPTPTSQPAVQASASTPVPSQDSSDDSDQSKLPRHGRHGDNSDNSENPANSGYSGAGDPSTSNLSTPGQSDSTNPSDDSDHPGHPNHPGHPDNPGNDDNSQGHGN